MLILVTQKKKKNKTNELPFKKLYNKGLMHTAYLFLNKSFTNCF